MEKRYLQAIKAGLACGLVIAVIYLVLGLAGMWVNSTPEMKAYTDQLLQNYRETLNTTYAYNYSSYNETPVVYPTFKSPQPPMIYYLGTAISLLSTAIVIIGLLATGVLSIMIGGQAKYKLKDAALVGVVSGIAAFAPVFVASLIMSGISAATGSLSTVSSMVPGSGPMLGPVVVLFSAFCCCLPTGVVVAVILGLIGSLGCALVSGKLER